MSQQYIQELQQDYENIKATLVHVFELKNSQYQKLIELKRINEDLSSENALHKSRGKMNEFM